jgi:hypothetical protein
VETILLVEALSGILFSLINIEYLPSLVSTIGSSTDLNSLSFFILALNNIEAFILVLDVAEVFISEDKDLPPS